MEKHSVVSVDIAKAVFDVAQSQEPGRVALRRRLSRGAFGVFLAQLPASTVVMEACPPVPIIRETASLRRLV